MREKKIKNIKHLLLDLETIEMNFHFSGTENP